MPIEHAPGANTAIWGLPPADADVVAAREIVANQCPSERSIEFAARWAWHLGASLLTVVCLYFVILPLFIKKYVVILETLAYGGADSLRNYAQISCDTVNDPTLVNDFLAEWTSSSGGTSDNLKPNTVSTLEAICGQLACNFWLSIRFDYRKVGDMPLLWTCRSPVWSDGLELAAGSLGLFIIMCVLVCKNKNTLSQIAHKIKRGALNVANIFRGPAARHTVPDHGTPLAPLTDDYGTANNPIRAV